LSCIETLYFRGVGVWRDDPRNPRRFEAGLKANAALGSIMAIGIQAMAPPDFIPVAGTPTRVRIFPSFDHRRIPPFGGLLGDGDRQALTVPNSKRYGETH
jgi:hypothetical protein